MRASFLLLTIAVYLGCDPPRPAATSTLPTSPADATIEIAPLASAAAPPIEIAPAPSASASSPGQSNAPPEPTDSAAAARYSGPKIHPAPPDAGFWPTRLCTSGPGKLVLERDGCDPPLVCTVHARGGALDLVIPRERRACKDCCVRIAVPCSVSGASDRTLALSVNGKPAVDRLEIKGGVYVGVPRCPAAR